MVFICIYCYVFGDGRRKRVEDTRQGGTGHGVGGSGWLEAGASKVPRERGWWLESEAMRASVRGGQRGQEWRSLGDGTYLSRTLQSFQDLGFVLMSVTEGT